MKIASSRKYIHGSSNGRRRAISIKENDSIIKRQHTKESPGVKRGNRTRTTLRAARFTTLHDVVQAPIYAAVHCTLPCWILRKSGCPAAE